MSSVYKPLRGKVARILNSRELVINIGSENGVLTGMYFDVLSTKGESIKDPESGEVLGSVERPKVRLKVIDVKEKISIVATYKSKRINVGGRGNSIVGLTNFLMPPKWIVQYETLKTNEKTWEDLDEKDSYVKTGDPVIQVDEIEEE